MEPRFDSLDSKMPNLGLSREEARLITDYFFDQYEGETGAIKRANASIKRLMGGSIRYRHLLIALIVGFVCGGLFVGLGWLALKRVTG